jgi:hypothetical protein
MGLRGFVSINFSRFQSFIVFCLQAEALPFSIKLSAACQGCNNFKNFGRMP